jgi:hypothetical protein
MAACGSNPQATKQHRLAPVLAAKARLIGRCFVARRFIAERSRTLEAKLTLISACMGLGQATNIALNRLLQEI